MLVQGQKALRTPNTHVRKIISPCQERRLGADAAESKVHSQCNHSQNSNKIFIKHSEASSKIQIKIHKSLTSQSNPEQRKATLQVRGLL